MHVAYTAHFIALDFVRFQVLTEANMKMAVVWVVAPYRLVEVYWRFRGASCFLHQGVEALRRLPSSSLILSL
jgi:hypothetical protein